MVALTVSKINSEHLSNLQLQVPIVDSCNWNRIWLYILLPLYGEHQFKEINTQSLIIYLEISFNYFFRPSFIRQLLFFFPNKLFHTNSWNTPWPSIFIWIKSWRVKGWSKIRVSCSVQFFITCTPLREIIFWWISIYQLAAMKTQLHDNHYFVFFTIFRMFPFCMRK